MLNGCQGNEGRRNLVCSRVEHASQIIAARAVAVWAHERSLQFQSSRRTEVFLSFFVVFGFNNESMAQERGREAEMLLALLTHRDELRRGRTLYAAPLFEKCSGE